MAIQRVTLLVDDQFPNNTSWRFVPESHVFPNPTNPFGSTFPESIELLNLGTDALDQDFVAIKVGDVSGNANPAMIQGAGALDWF